ncbi:MAG: GyrI-like domain-containing protein [Verrucomicrobiota bacterium]
MPKARKDNVTHSTAMDYRKRVSQAMNYISENLDRQLSLKEIAQAASFSMFHFHRIFKAVVGETVAEFTRRLRLELAATHLRSNRHATITIIAMDCGFSSSQNFAKAFHQHFGMSPTEYRKSKGGNIHSKNQNALSLVTSYHSEHTLMKSMYAERKILMNAEVREMAEHHVAYVRKIGSYYSRETYEQACNELMRWARPKDLLNSGKLMGVYLDNPHVTPEEKCRLDACISVPPGTLTERQIAIQVINGGLHGVCHFELQDNSFQQAWGDAFTWLVDSGYECDQKPCYELYHNNPSNHPENKWVVDICIPLKN